MSASSLSRSESRPKAGYARPRLFTEPMITAADRGQRDFGQGRDEGGVRGTRVRDRNVEQLHCVFGIPIGEDLAAHVAGERET